VASELNKQGIKTLISLVNLEINRLGEVKEKQGCSDLTYFYHLIEIRNKLLALPLKAKPPCLGDKELVSFPGAKGEIKQMEECESGYTNKSKAG